MSLEDSIAFFAEKTGAIRMRCNEYDEGRNELSIQINGKGSFIDPSQLTALRSEICKSDYSRIIYDYYEGYPSYYWKSARYLDDITKRKMFKNAPKSGVIEVTNCKNAADTLYSNICYLMGGDDKTCNPRLLRESEILGIPIEEQRKRKYESEKLAKFVLDRSQNIII